MEEDQRSRASAEPGAWVAWHDVYDRPGSGLARRLAVVRRRIGDVLDVAVAGAAAASGPLRILSLCAGDGRDLLPELAARPGLAVRQGDRGRCRRCWHRAAR